MKRFRRRICAKPSSSSNSRMRITLAGVTKCRRPGTYRLMMLPDWCPAGVVLPLLFPPPPLSSAPAPTFYLSPEVRFTRRSGRDAPAAPAQWPAPPLSRKDESSEKKEGDEVLGGVKGKSGGEGGEEGTGLPAMIRYTQTCSLPRLAACAGAPWPRQAATLTVAANVLLRANGVTSRVPCSAPGSCVTHSRPPSRE